MAAAGFRVTLATMSNKYLACRFLDLVSDGDLDGLTAMVAPTWIMYGGPPHIPPGAAGIRHLFATIGRVEQKWTIDDVIAEGDKVVVRATNTCVQDSLFGIPSRDVTQVFTATFIHRVADGLIQETWRNADDLGRLHQIGAVIRLAE
jgi:ketosteroid isomerase-like protein